MKFSPDTAISSKLPNNCCCCFSYSFYSPLCTLSMNLVGWLFDWDLHKIIDSGSGYGASEDRLMYVLPGDKFCCPSSWQNEIWCPPGPSAHVSLNSISSDLQYLLDIKLPVSLVLANKQGDLQVLWMNCPGSCLDIGRHYFTDLFGLGSENSELCQFMSRSIWHFVLHFDVKKTVWNNCGLDNQWELVPPWRKAARKMCYDNHKPMHANGWKERIPNATCETLMNDWLFWYFSLWKVQKRADKTAQAVQTL